ncbi:MAG TPA: hypothetical protein VGQ15_11100 [Gaiellaceae bacterium]|nr:hypothetical protein [Gaiellaceae bacterium]
MPAWLAMWVALWWLWMLLVGEWNRDELIAATVAATIAATIGELARTRAGVKPSAPSLTGAWKIPYAVVADFAILMWQLPRGRRGVFRERPAAGAWPAFLANLSPNAYVVDMDDDRVVLHDLVPRRASEEPL